MPFTLRRIAPVLLAAGLVFVVGCGSNNKGKIVGKWKTTSLPGGDEQAKELRKKAEDVSLIIDFTADGKMVGTASVTMLGQTHTKEVLSADYSLGSGDWVFCTNINPPPKDGKKKSKDKIVINGDTMIIDTEKGEKITLTRVK